MERGGRRRCFFIPRYEQASRFSINGIDNNAWLPFEPHQFQKTRSVFLNCKMGSKRQSRRCLSTRIIPILRAPNRRGRGKKLSAQPSIRREEQTYEPSMPRRYCCPKPSTGHPAINASKDKAPHRAVSAYRQMLAKLSMPRLTVAMLRSRRRNRRGLFAREARESTTVDIPTTASRV